MFKFEKLSVWQKAIDFAGLIYSLTKTFPDSERFGLVTQMRRAAVSVSSNIAEGSARSSDTDYAHFLGIAAGSVFELVTQATIAKNQTFLAEAEYQKLYRDAEEISRMLSGLRATLKSSR